MFKSFLFLLVSVRQLVFAQFDPIENFCRRIDHQSTLINGTVYVDGGRAVFTTNNENGTEVAGSPRTLGNNQFLIAIDVSQSWDWQNSLPQRVIPKIHEAATNVPIPDMSRGTLYPDSSDSNKFWLFGGTTATDNTTFSGYQAPQPEAWSLWSYESESDIWTGYDMSKFGIHKPSSGPSTYVPEKGLAFWFNGMQDQGSAVETTVLGFPSFLDGMVILDLNNQTAKNVSTAAVSTKARVRGQMVHIPLSGSDGILVMVGGGEKSSSDLSADWKGTLVSLSTVHVFDVGSLNNASTPNGVWYAQSTTGLVPAPRIDACIVVASAPDNSSHNIILYGGRDGASKYFDETWVLTLPSFQWTLVASGLKPRYGHTCHVVGNRQMITTGGSDTANLISGCDWHTRGVGVLDMTTTLWASTYNATAAPYLVPDQIVKLVGGTSNGGATTLEPVNGFSNSGLKELFNPSLKSSTTNPKSSSSSGTTAAGETSRSTSNMDGNSKKQTSTGAIAGGVIGSLLCFAVLLGLILLLLRRVKQERVGEQQDSAELEATYKDHPILDSHPVFEKSGVNEAVFELGDSDSAKEDGKSPTGTAVVHEREPEEMVGSDVSLTSDQAETAAFLPKKISSDGRDSPPPNVR